MRIAILNDQKTNPDSHPTIIEAKEFIKNHEELINKNVDYIIKRMASMPFMFLPDFNTEFVENAQKTLKKSLSTYLQNNASTLENLVKNQERAIRNGQETQLFKLSNELGPAVKIHFKIGFDKALTEGFGKLFERMLLSLPLEKTPSFEEEVYAQ